MISTSFLLLVGAYSVLASPSPRGEPTDIRLNWHKDKATGAGASLATSEDGSRIFGQSCSDSVTFGGGSHSAAFEVSHTGAGTVEVAGQKYAIHADREKSGGASCTRMFNAKSVTVECVVPWASAAVQLEEVAEEAPSCFNGTSNPLARRAAPRGMDIEPRQMDMCVPRSRMQKHGNGNPVAWWWDEQVSGGFSVQKSMTNSEGHNCAGVEADRVCVWYSQGYIEYEVQMHTSLACGDFEPEGDVLKITSPSKVPGEFYCVVDTCRKVNDGYWHQEPMKGMEDVGL